MSSSKNDLSPLIDSGVRLTNDNDRDIVGFNNITADESDAETLIKLNTSEVSSAGLLYRLADVARQQMSHDNSDVAHNISVRIYMCRLYGNSINLLDVSCP